MENPQKIIDQAEEGDTVHLSLRGPHTDQELEEVKKLHEESHPGVKFIVSWDYETVGATLEKGSHG